MPPIDSKFLRSLCGPSASVRVTGPPTASAHEILKGFPTVTVDKSGIVKITFPVV